MVKQDTRTRIVFALVRQDGQLNKELIKNADTNHNSLAIELDRLQKDNVIVKDAENRYWFSTKLENNVLKALGSAYTIIKSLDRFAEELEKANNPFQDGSKKIADILRLQAILRLERFASPKLSKRDKLEFDLYFDMFDVIIEWIFDILQKKDPKKTQSMKIQLMDMVKGK